MAEYIGPQMTDLPSMLPPAWVDELVWSTPAAARAGLPACSAPMEMPVAPIRSSAIAAPIASPCLMLPTQRPYMTTSENGISSSRKISSWLVNPLGFSNGCALLALNGPPPLLPRSLIASCEAKGPTAMVCVACSSVCATG